ncbi:MAG TPA: Tim44 domain-containing protein [Methylomirabilota bacterium]
MKTRGWLFAIVIVMGTLVLADAGHVWARVGGGGSRGSRSYSAPAKPAPATPATPSTPSRSYNPQPTPPPAAARPSLFRGLMTGLAGFAIGGLIGSLLFGGLGHGFGIGLFDILLIGGGLLLLMSVLRRRRADAPAPAYAGAPGAARYDYVPDGSVAGTAVAVDPAAADLERGIGHIRAMDASFDPAAFAAHAPAVFRAVQGGLAMRDLASLREELTPEMYSELQSQADRLRSARRTNRVERIEIKRSEVTEAWQESGRDYVTIYLSGSLLDWVVDDTTGAVVEGSPTTPSEFEEYWTFARPVGRNRWMLSAIQTA